jgi:2Fe-2S ferredoxin
MIKLNVTPLEGPPQSLEVKPGTSLMDPLRDAGMVDATCGGAASCGTCHIYAGDDWIKSLGERTEDEGYMLEALEDFVDIKPVSRLACQVTLSDEHDGLTLEIAPQA